MEITYIEQHGYLLPNLTLPKEETTYGHFGRTRKAYLKEHRRSFYNFLLLSGSLESHLVEVDTQANEILELLTTQIVQSQGITETLKVQDQIAWTGAMNNSQARAEEIVYHEIVLGV